MLVHRRQLGLLMRRAGLPLRCVTTALPVQETDMMAQSVVRQDV